ncbi:MAG: AzlD domain-containing protein [Treponema sp.]|nr:AzlD domain-containing protein [Treponema sp.]
MSISTSQAVLYSALMGLAIFFCRAAPFLFFRGKGGGKAREAFLVFVEKVVPPAAMTVLAFNSLAGPVKEDVRLAIPVFTAAALSAALHLWKRNPLLSIFGATAVYMLLVRLLPLT